MDVRRRRPLRSRPTCMFVPGGQGGGLIILLSDTIRLNFLFAAPGENESGYTRNREAGQMQFRIGGKSAVLHLLRFHWKDSIRKQDSFWRNKRSKIPGSLPDHTT